jgi:septal ring factor EnvC (AmiA/AmiB activator)
MSGKKKTTFAKMARERKLQERRLEKKAKKDARKQGIHLPQTHEIDETGPLGSSVGSADPLGE